MSQIKILEGMIAAYSAFFNYIFFSHLIDSGNYWWSIILTKNNIMSCQIKRVHTMDA